MGEPLFSQIVIAFCAFIMAACAAMLFMLLKNNANTRRSVSDAETQAVSAPPAQEVAQPTDDGALIAAISAAVAMYLAADEKASPLGFVVRRVRRVSGGSSWQRAGRDEQVYGRM